MDFCKLISHFLGIGDHFRRGLLQLSRIEYLVDAFVGKEREYGFPSRDLMQRRVLPRGLIHPKSAVPSRTVQVHAHTVGLHNTPDVLSHLFS